MILKIGICDDEQLVAENLERIIAEYLKAICIDPDIKIFLSGKELLEAVTELDAVFLDIRMPEMDGYETLKKIEESDADCQMVVASGETDRFEEAFEMGVFRYIRKPFKKEKVGEALDRIIERYKENSEIELYKERNKYQIKQSRIKYVKAYNGYTEYYVGQDIMRKEISLNEADKILNDKMFFRVHKKYSVNMEYIHRYSNGIITIEGVEFPVSRRKKSEFEKNYISYCFSKGE